MRPQRISQSRSICASPPKPLAATSVKASTEEFITVAWLTFATVKLQLVLPTCDCQTAMVNELCNRGTGPGFSRINHVRTPYARTVSCPHKVYTQLGFVGLGWLREPPARSGAVARTHCKRLSHGTCVSAGSARSACRYRKRPWVEDKATKRGRPTDPK